MVSIAWSIDRTSLSLSALTLSQLVPDANGISRYVTKASPDLGKVPAVNTLASSPYIDGSVLVHSKLGLVPSKITVRVEAFDFPRLLTDRAQVIAAFRQLEYTLTWSSSDGGSQTFDCQRADVSMLWAEDFSYAMAAELSFNFNRQPNPSDY